MAAFFSLVPRDKHFFKEFVSLAEEVRFGHARPEADDCHRPAGHGEGRTDQGNRARLRSAARASIIDRLNRTFVTPLDREDIHALAGSLDDVMDAIDAAGRRHPPLQDHARQPRRAAPGRDRLRFDGSASPRRWRCSKRRDGVLEIAGARQPARARGRSTCTRTPSWSCSTRERDPIAVIKWKEIFDFLEAATDRCEDVANLLEGVVVKHG